jgi:hypothetical protein
MTRPRLGRDTGPAFVRSETDGAEERSRADRDRASHLLPRRWRPRKVGSLTASLTEGVADPSESALVARRMRM